MKKRITHSMSGEFLMLALFLVLMTATAPVGAQDRIFKAGASLSNITPPLGLEIVGNYNRPQADYIHDQLHVRTVVLNDGKETLVFAIVDNVAVKREVYDATKAIIQNKL